MDLKFTVNGRPWHGDVPEAASLLEVLRDHVGLTGTKYGCGEGQCGSCTVLVGGRLTRACVARPAPDVAVLTIEGLARDGHLHPLQQAFIDAQAFQCGFCTPGMILGALALLQETPRPSDAQVRAALDPHLCRCGTYPRIIDAVRRAADAMARTQA